MDFRPPELWETNCLLSYPAYGILFKQPEQTNALANPDKYVVARSSAGKILSWWHLHFQREHFKTHRSSVTKKFDPWWWNSRHHDRSRRESYVVNGLIISDGDSSENFKCPAKKYRIYCRQWWVTESFWEGSIMTKALLHRDNCQQCKGFLLLLLISVTFIIASIYWALNSLPSTLYALSLFNGEKILRKTLKWTKKITHFFFQ